MAHFAEVNKDWIVQRVVTIADKIIVDDLGIIQEWLGEQFCQQVYGSWTKWVHTVPDGSKYKNFAATGYRFDPYKNAFIPPAPYKGWILNEQTYRWEPPVPKPSDDLTYVWIDETESWEVTAYTCAR